MDINCDNILNGLEWRTTVIIKNIKHSWGALELWNYVERIIPFGISSVKVPMDDNTGNNLGYGFVGVVTPICVVYLITYLQGEIIVKGKPIQIEYSRFQYWE